VGILSNDITTGDVLSGVPNRMMERDIRRLTAKMRAGEPLSQAEEQALSRHQAYTTETSDKAATAGMEATAVRWSMTRHWLTRPT
jgi:hypothetical protein